MSWKSNETMGYTWFGYKKVKDNNKSMGMGTMPLLFFLFFFSKNELLGAQHDIDFSVVVTRKGVDVQRPEVKESTTTQQKAQPPAQHWTGERQ